MKYLLALLFMLVATSAHAQAPTGPPVTPVGFGGVGAGLTYTSFTKQWFNCNESGNASLRQRLQYIRDYRNYERANNITPPHPFLLYAFYAECDITLLSELPPVDDRTALHGKGATLRGYGFSVRGKDSTVVDFRIMNPGTAEAPRDGITIHFGAARILVQHVTVIGASDGSIDITEGAQDITVMRSLLASPLSTPARAGTNMIIFDGSAECPATVETKRVTLYGNVYVNGPARNPLIQRDNCGNLATDTTAEVVSNVVANWSSFPEPNVAGQGTVVLDGAKVNVVGNYYTNPNVPPGNTQRQQNGILVCHPDATTGCAGLQANGEAYVPVGSNLLAQQPTWDFNAAEATTATAFPTTLNYATLPSACDAAAAALASAGAITGGRTAAELAELATVQVSGC